MLTLGQAARLTATSKTTITRAIKAGRLSATRRDDGSYEIDPAELSRVYRVAHEATPATVTAVHHATRGDDPVPALESQIEGLKVQLALMREHLDEIRDQRDGWQKQAEATQRLLEDQRPAKRGWFGLRF